MVLPAFCLKSLRVPALWRLSRPPEAEPELDGPLRGGEHAPALALAPGALPAHGAARRGAHGAHGRRAAVGEGPASLAGRQKAAQGGEPEVGGAGRGAAAGGGLERLKRLGRPGIFPAGERCLSILEID